MVYDVIVSGIGPAGVGFLKGIEGSGLKVLAIDREEFPRRKACAGGLTPKAYRLLKVFFSDIDKVVKEKVNAFSLFNEKKAVRLISNSPLTYLTDRKELDYFLFNKIGSLNEFDLHTGEVVLGAVREGKLIKVFTDKGKYRCRVLISSDGANSKLTRSFAVKRDFGFTYEGDYEGSLSDIVIDFTGFSWGYYWIFPKGDFLTAGLGEFKNFKNLKDRLTLLNKKHGISSSSFWEGGFPIPIGKRKNDVLRDGILFLGDAGGLVDPLTGEGIYYAFKSGLAAAEAVGRSFEKGDFKLLEVYKRYVDKHFGKEFFGAKLIGSIFFRTKNFNLLIVEKRREIANLTLKLLSGEISYLSAFKLFLTLLPKAILRW